MQKLISIYRTDEDSLRYKGRGYERAISPQEHLNEFLDDGWTVLHMTPFGVGTGLGSQINKPKFNPELMQATAAGYLAVALDDGITNKRHKLISIYRGDWQSDGSPKAGIQQTEHLEKYFKKGWKVIDMQALGAGSGQDASGGGVQGYLAVLLEKQVSYPIG